MTENLPPDLRLASEPGRWHVVLGTGETILVLAHGYSIDGADYVFSLLIDDEPSSRSTLSDYPARSWNRLTADDTSSAE